MDDILWKRVEDLYHAVLEHAPEKRDTFLNSACRDDLELRREVESLLGHGQTNSFFEEPAWAGALKLAEPSTSTKAPLSKGAVLGSYRVIDIIGAGGMGEVYRARDTLLKRDVAIKVLPDSWSRDADRLRRFELEAQATAALNHPNIVSIFHVGQYDASPYIVTELLQGETLRDRLRRGSLRPREACDLGVNIARGLAAAHSAGIVHRDLKPENLFLTKEGRLKILDFGLAKLTQVQAVSTDSTCTIRDQTDPGLVLGTVGYMAPEQVRGQATDARSDIFAFGLVLYEMLTGRRAFQKATSAETMSAILNDEPAMLSASVQNIPPPLVRIVSRCLEKKPERRFQHASDLEFALETFSDSSSTATPDVGEAVSYKRRIWLEAAAVTTLLAAVVLAAHWWWTAPQLPSWSGVALGGPEFSYSPQVSPDGHTLAMVGAIQDCGQPIVMMPATGNYAILSQDRTHGYAHSVTWSPDGTLLYFARLAGGPTGVFSVPALGGEVRLLLPNAAAPRALRDGSLLVNRMNENRRFQVYRFWPESGRLEALPFLLGDENRFAHTVAVPFPDGKRALIYAINARAPEGKLAHLYVLDLDTGTSRQLPSELENGLFAIEVSRAGTILLSRRRGQLYEVVETTGSTGVAFFLPAPF